MYGRCTQQHLNSLRVLLYSRAVGLTHVTICPACMCHYLAFTYTCTHFLIVYGITYENITSMLSSRSSSTGSTGAYIGT